MSMYRFTYYNKTRRLSINTLSCYLYITLKSLMQVEKKSIECICHRCKYRWLYRGNSKYIACCPRCKMTVYIPKMLRLLNAHRDTIYGTPDVEVKDKNPLDVRFSRSLTSSESICQNTHGR
jgi:hypothetical protein